MTPTDILAEVLEGPRSPYARLPDLERTERPGWVQITTPSFTTGGFNEVAWSRLEAAEADAVIDATIAGYRARGLAFRWVVGPDSAPADLGARLAARGLVPSPVIAMARPITPADRAVTAPPEVEVRAVAPGDAEGLATFTRVMAEGWGVDPAPLLAAHAHLLADPEGGQRLFLASLAGQPAATASYVALPRSAFLIGGVVLPAARGRGLYRALVAARLADAAARGLGLATSHATAATSAPVLARLGFARVCDLVNFRG